MGKLRKENVMLRSIIVDNDLEIAYLKELLKDEPKLSDKLIVSDEAIKTLLFDLAEEYPLYGYKKLTALLKSLFGIRINKKKVYRLCKEMGLLLPVERHYQPEEYPIAFKKVALNAPNNHWQMDMESSVDTMAYYTSEYP